MVEYTKTDRLADTQYFETHYDELHRKYGKCFLAMQHQNVLGAYLSIEEAVEKLSSKYEFGTYTIHKCIEDEKPGKIWIGGIW